jgi:FtsZ-interacting cell division protein ZipA
MTPITTLRWILLVVGLVFLAVLAAWERRKPRQAQGDPAVRKGARNEPAVGSMIEPQRVSHPSPGAPGDAAAGAAEARRPVAIPPRIDLPLESLRDEPMLVDDEGLQQLESQPGPEAAAQEPEPSPERLAAVPPATAAPTSLMVDWPPDGARHILALRIVAATPERFSGRAVRLAITACGFVHGRFGIYHQPDREGRALLSVASLSKPGILDPVNMDFQRLTGISLFTVLPGPLPPAAALDHLIDTARELSQRLPARVQDEQGQPLDAERLEELRDRMQNLSGPEFHAEPAA